MEERFQLFTTLVANINRSIRKIKTEEMSEFNLKSVHVSCVYYLYREGQLTVSQLCDVCEEDKANISRSVEHLEECGYIVSRPKDTKRYKSPIELTESGREIGKIIENKIDKILSRSSAGLPEEDREILYRGLGIICENLQKICDHYDAEATK